MAAYDQRANREISNVIGKLAVKVTTEHLPPLKKEYIVYYVRSAQAGKLFGSEVTGEAAGSCGGEGVYVVKETTTYFFGIPISTSYQVYDANNNEKPDPCNLVGAYKDRMGIQPE